MIQNAPFETFCYTFDLHCAIISLENHFGGLFESGRFTQVLLYLPCTCITYAQAPPLKVRYGVSGRVRGLIFSRSPALYASCESSGETAHMRMRSLA